MKNGLHFPNHDVNSNPGFKMRVATLQFYYGNLKLN